LFRLSTGGKRSREFKALLREVEAPPRTVAGKPPSIFNGNLFKRFDKDVA
jgi:hypothetical protein